MIYRAYYGSRNFTFEGFGKTENQARKALQQALDLHTLQYDCDPDWYEGYEVEIYCYSFGVPYRDGQTMVEACLG